jgi:formylglycine-generating enzyme required for sulfatase activity
MGADPGFQGDGEYEKPAHQVIISKPFWLSRSEVTQAQWSAVMGTRPSVRKGANLPVDDVSWEDAQKFIEILAEREGRKYRLPTEAEWEYAARAGTETAYFFGDDPKSMSEYAHCGRDFAGSSPAPVMDKAPNAFGLFDMAGNLSEWVSDWFSEDYYAKSPRTNPKGPAGGSEKVHRGGAYASDPKACQSAWRNSDLPFVRSMTIGFRLAYDE